MRHCFRDVIRLALTALLLVSKSEQITSAKEEGSSLGNALTNTAALRQLTIPHANHGVPIRVEGVVTLADSNRKLLVLQDAVGALAIRMDFDAGKVQPGLRVRLTADSAAPQMAAFPEFPLAPSGRELRASFSAPTNWGVFYLDRMSGYLVPPATGDYSFSIASKGASELWLSTNADSRNAQRIAQVETSRSTNPGQWSKYPVQSSALIHLEAGKTYWIDAIREQHSGRTDHLEVAWQGPGIERAVIEGRFLKPELNSASNGIVREYWNDYFASSVEALTRSGGIEAITILNGKVEVLEPGAFPKAMPVEIGMPMAGKDNYRWAEVEGTVRFAAVHDGLLALELKEGKFRLQARVFGWKGDVTRLQNAWVRIRGVCESVFDANGEECAGILSVPSPRELMEITPDTGNIKEIRSIPISELNPENPALAWGRRIHVRGTVLHRGTNEIIVQSYGSFCAYTASDGIHWKKIAPPVEVEMSGHSSAGLAISSYSQETLAKAVVDSVSGFKNDQIRSVDVFDAPPPGKASRQESAWMLEGGGAGISSTYDQFHYLYEPECTNDEIVAHIESLNAEDPRAVVGIMMRDTLDPHTSFAAAGATRAGSVVFQFRQKNGERGATLTLADCAIPCWLKLTRRFFQVQLVPDENAAFDADQEVDVVGALEWKDGHPILTRAHRMENAPGDRRLLPRKNGTMANDAGEAAVWQIGQLVPDESEGLRKGSGTIRIRGVVTFNGNTSSGDFLSIQDQSAGALTRLSSRFARRTLHERDFVEFGLTSVNGKWPMPLEPTRIQVLGRALLPEPVVHPAEYSLVRGGEGHWSEFTGIVRKVIDGDRLDLMCRGGTIAVWVGDASTNLLRSYVDALVRIRGILGRSRENGRELLVPSPEYIQVSEAPPADAFEIPEIKIGNLTNFNHAAEPFHRVKISGVVTYRNNGLLVVQGDSAGVRVRSDSVEAEPGDCVVAIGFPDSQSDSVSLVESEVRKTGGAAVLAAIQPEITELQQGAHDGQLVRLTAQLVDQYVSGPNQIFELQSGRGVFRAILSKKNARAKPIPAGSTVEVTGICWTDRMDGRTPDIGFTGEALLGSFELLLRAPADIVMRHRPPWWTWKHAVATIGALLFVLAAALVWIRTLRRKVTQRTHELEVAMGKLERETEISATLAERNRLAGELHDGLEQGLSGIMMQLDGLEAKLAENSPDAMRHLKLARNMVRFSRTEVRHSLWDWKSPALEKDLGTALTHIVAQMSAGSHTRVGVNISGTQAALPSVIEHHLLRISQEALNNALKYADAAAVTISLAYSEDLIRLSIGDDGKGFDPESVQGSAGHLGLQNLRSRARKIGGRLTITSAPGQGTTIEVVVPLSENPMRSHKK